MRAQGPGTQARVARRPPSAAFPQMPKCPDRERGLELTNTAGRRGPWDLTLLLCLLP